MTIRIMIVDDHAMLRTGLHTWLESVADYDVVGEAGDGTAALRVARELRPDVVLMDISLPSQGGGIATTRALCEQFPGVRILMLTMHEDENLLRESIEAGASGYVIKRAVQTELIDAIRAVARGDVYIHPAMTRSFLKSNHADVDHPATAMESLTPREIEVARLIAKGYTSRDIADQLHISMRTVEFHRANLMSKLSLRSRVELMRYMETHKLE